jgi:DNA-binding MarR family transcriptional regulator
MPRLAPLMRVLRLSGLLEKELAQIAKDQLITSAQFQVLAALLRHDPRPQSLSELTRIAILTSGSMTSLVDRLEERDFVRRQRHPTDRRGVLIALTNAGRDVINTALKARVSRLHALADAAPADELNHVSQALRKLLLDVDPPADRREDPAA